MKNLILLNLIIVAMICGFSSSAQILYSEDFTNNPNFISLAPTKAYWDEANGNYYVQTFDNLNEKYWAYSPKFETADALKNVKIKFDMLCENTDWGTYPRVSFYNTEPIDIANETGTITVSFTWTDQWYKLISISSKSNEKTSRYFSKNNFENNKWYSVEISYFAATNKADIIIVERAAGTIFFQVDNVDFYLSDFSYLAVGYYNNPDYGDEWSPIRLDNVEIKYSNEENNPTTLMNGLISYWNFDEGTGILANDSKVNVNGNITGASWTTLGKFGNALSFGGYNTKNRVSLGTSINPAHMETGTFSAWIYPTSLSGIHDGNHKTIFGQGSGTSGPSAYPFWIKIDAGGNNIRINRGGTSSSLVDTSTGIEVNNWYHIVCTMDSDSGKIFINGELKVKGPLNRVGGTNYDLAIGNLGNTTTVYGNTFPGMIDEPAIWNRELSADEIKVLYNNGSGLAYPFDGQISDPVISEGLYPVFKYHIIQDGSRGIKVGMTIISLFNISMAQTAYDFLAEVYLLILENARDYLLDDTFPSAKYATGCIKFNGDNLENPLSNIVFILEEKEEIKVGKPFVAQLQKINYENVDDPDIVPPNIYAIKENSYSGVNLPEDYMTIFDVGTNVSAPFSSPINFSTHGVVNEYIIHEDNGLNMKLMLLYCFDKDWVFNPNTFTFSFIAVDVSDFESLPALGSLVYLSGSTKRFKNSYVKREYEIYGSEKIYSYISIDPSDLKIINGKTTTNPIYNTSVFFHQINEKEFDWGKPVSQMSSIVGVQFPDESKQFPDFVFEENEIEITPDEFINPGSQYSVKASLKNIGKIEGNCNVKAYTLIGGTEKTIGNMEVTDLRPGEKKVLNFNWIPEKSSDFISGTSRVYFSITNSRPLESNTNNNSIFKEFYFLNQVGLQTQLIVTTYCPVTLKVTDPLGRYIDIHNNFIDGAEYIVDDFDGNFSVDNRVIVPELIEGKYEFEVIPIENAETDDTYTLTLASESEIIVLADSVKIADLPLIPYYHVVTSNNMIQNTPEKIFQVYLSNQQIHIFNNGQIQDEFFVEVFDLLGKSTYAKWHKILPCEDLHLNVHFQTMNLVRISNEKLRETFLVRDK